MVTFCQLFVLSCRWFVALSVSFSGACKALFHCIAYACGTGKIRRAGFLHKFILFFLSVASMRTCMYALKMILQSHGTFVFPFVFLALFIP